MKPKKPGKNDSGQEGGSSSKKSGGMFMGQSTPKINATTPDGPVTADMAAAGMNSLPTQYSVDQPSWWQNVVTRGQAGNNAQALQNSLLLSNQAMQQNQQLNAAKFGMDKAMEVIRTTNASDSAKKLAEESMKRLVQEHLMSQRGNEETDIRRHGYATQEQAQQFSNQKSLKDYESNIEQKKTTDTRKYVEGEELKRKSETGEGLFNSPLGDNLPTAYSPGKEDYRVPLTPKYFSKVADYASGLKTSQDLTKSMDVTQPTVRFGSDGRPISIAPTSNRTEHTQVTNPLTNLPQEVLRNVSTPASVSPLPYVNPNTVGADGNINGGTLQSKPAPNPFEQAMVNVQRGDVRNTSGPILSEISDYSRGLRSGIKTPAIPAGVDLGAEGTTSLNSATPAVKYTQDELDRMRLELMKKQLLIQQQRQNALQLPQ